MSVNSDSTPQIIIFDTTLRDGEIALNTKLTIQQKLELAQRLEAMHVDVIEVGYPGVYRKDCDAIFMTSKRIKHATICGLASSQSDEIASVAVALKPTVRGRINVFTSIKLPDTSQICETQTLSVIRDSISLARNYRDDVQWTAFDATSSRIDFLCRSIETAIKSGATTVTIADNAGTASPETFAQLLETITNRVPNIDRTTIAVHCYDGLGFAVENSLLSLSYGVRQIACSINGLGASKGNANLAQIVQKLTNLNYYTRIDMTLMKETSALVTTLSSLHDRS